LLLQFIVFFKSLYFSGQRKDDLSKSVPTLYYPKQDRIPSVWSANDIEQLLSVIDRGNPKGKRDYALIFLVTQLGLRTSDVLNLKLENINWSESRIEFVLKHIQPFDRMKNGHYLITQYLVKAGIPLKTAKHHGLHSLRHTLASRLLEQDVPLEIISSILGHTTVESTKPYLHIDIENLRKCALVSREVAENE
jgi:site-specific recombinase XerD